MRPIKFFKCVCQNIGICELWLSFTEMGYKNYAIKTKDYKEHL